MSEPEDLPAFDATRLAAEIRAGDAFALAQAFRHVFTGELGRLVLAAHARDCFVAQQIGPGQSADDLQYRAGLHDGALKLAQAAGYDQAALITTILANPIQEPEDHDRSRDDGHPDANWGDGYQPDPTGELDGFGD